MTLEEATKEMDTVYAEWSGPTYTKQLWMEAEPLSREAKDPRFDVMTKADGRYPLTVGERHAGRLSAVVRRDQGCVPGESDRGEEVTS